MSAKGKKKIAENILFLLLGLILGIIGNLWASSVVEFCNIMIASRSEVVKLGFWVTFTLGMSYALLSILEKFSIGLTNLGMEVLSNEQITFYKRVRKYCQWIFISAIPLLILTWIWDFYR